MKKILIFIGLFSYLAVNAQVAIEKETFRSNGSIMEFNDMAENNGQAKGIILPTLQDSSKVKEGALWVDSQTKEVMYKSKDEKVALTDSYPDGFVTPKNADKAESGVIISDGSKKTDDPAVLKLDSNKRALLLPHVKDVTKDISNPEIGTIAYDEKSKSLAIFNGNYWFFWN